MPRLGLRDPVYVWPWPDGNDTIGRLDGPTGLLPKTIGGCFGSPRRI